MKLIPLTQGQFAKVSDEWYEELNKFKWYAVYNPCTESFYANRNSSRLFGKQKKILMHRVIAGTPDGMETDHRDGDTLNNLPDNLRNCTNIQNQCNRGKQANNKSGFKGVTWYKRSKIWRVQIKVYGKVIHLGYYLIPEQAARAYDKAAKKYFGEFAKLNYPNE